MRTGIFVAYVALQFLGLMLAIGQIGKERKPIDSTNVIVGFVMSAGYVAAIWYLWAR